MPSRSDLISSAVTLVAVVLGYIVGGPIAAIVCLGLGVLILIVAQFLKERSRTETAPSSPIQQDADPTVSQHANPVVNVDIGAEILRRKDESTKPGARPTAQSNLVLMKPEIGTFYLVGDVWSRKLPEGPPRSFERYQAIFAEIQNAPKEDEEVGPVSGVRAELVVGDAAFTPLPWLDEYLSTVTFRFGDVKDVILAVGMPTRSPALGDWRVVRHCRTGQEYPAGASSMDFDRFLKRVAPESRVKLNLLQVTSGKVLRSFEGVCQWKEVCGIPIISFK